jgi:hypothetical protein
MKKTLFATAIACLVFIACQKNKDPAPAPKTVPSVAGLWKGKYNLTKNGPITENVIYNLKKDGTMRVYNGSDTTTANPKGSGEWTKLEYTKNLFLIRSQYAYQSDPKAFFSILFITDTTYTQSIEGLWYTGQILYDPSKTVSQGELTLFKSK